MARVPFGVLPREGAKELRAASSLSRGALNDALRFARSVAVPGQTLKPGTSRVVRVSASQARAILTAGTPSSPLVWNAPRMTLVVRATGAPVADYQMKAAAEAAVRAANFRIQEVALRAQQGEISGARWYGETQAAVRDLQVASEAAARGGFGNLSPQTAQRIEGRVYEQFAGREGKFPGLRAFAEDAARGRYGAELEQSSFLQRAGMYADSGRSTYENARQAVHKEEGYEEAKRILGAADHCEFCVEEAGEWKPIDDVPEIGDAECGARCHCTIIFRKV